MNNQDSRERFLDAEIRAAVRRRVSPGQPSVEFVGRVLAAAGEQAPSLWRLRLPWRIVWAAAALAGAIGAAIYVRQVRMEVPPEVMTLSNWRSPTAVLLQQPAPSVPRLGEAYFRVKTY